MQLLVVRCRTVINRNHLSCFNRGRYAYGTDYTGEPILVTIRIEPCVAERSQIHQIQDCICLIANKSMQIVETDQRKKVIIIRTAAKYFRIELKKKREKSSNWMPYSISASYYGSNTRSLIIPRQKSKN